MQAREIIARRVLRALPDTEKKTLPSKSRVAKYAKNTRNRSHQGLQAVEIKNRQLKSEPNSTLAQRTTASPLQSVLQHAQSPQPKALTDIPDGCAQRNIPAPPPPPPPPLAFAMPQKLASETKSSIEAISNNKKIDLIGALNASSFFQKKVSELNSGTPAATSDAQAPLSPPLPAQPLKQAKFSSASIAHYEKTDLVEALKASRFFQQKVSELNSDTPAASSGAQLPFIPPVPAQSLNQAKFSSASVANYEKMDLVDALNKSPYFQRMADKHS